MSYVMNMINSIKQGSVTSTHVPNAVCVNIQDVITQVRPQHCVKTKLTDKTLSQKKSHSLT